MKIGNDAQQAAVANGRSVSKAEEPVNLSYTVTPAETTVYFDELKLLKLADPSMMNKPCKYQKKLILIYNVYHFYCNQYC